MDATIHQTIGALNAKADQSQADVTGLRADVRGIESRISALPAQVEEIVQRLLSPVDGRLKAVETNLTDVQQTVGRWKAVLTVMASGAAVVGYLISQFVSLKKLFGVG